MAEEINEKPEENSPEHNNDKLAKALGAISDMVSSLGKRMDAYETASKARADEDMERRQLELRQHGGGKPIDREKERADNAERAECQAKADAVFLAHGKQAPPAMHGETTKDYRIRLAKALQPMCKEFADADLTAIGDSTAFDFIEQKIYADAFGEASHPSHVPEGRLHVVTTRSDAGHTIKTYHGTFEAGFGRFMQIPRLVTRIETKSQAA